MTTRLVTTPRKTPRQARSAATVYAILSATARVLVREGYDRASTNRIAETAGVSIGSLYQYYPTKEALVAALVDRHMSEMTQLLTSNIDTLRAAPIPIATRTLVRLMLAAHACNPRLHKVMSEQVPRIGRMGRFYELEGRIAEQLLPYLEAHRTELRVKNVELATFLMVNMVEALTHATVVDHPDKYDEEELTTEITSIVLRYIMRRPPD
jgi:AcrR family transcriptional regulator